MSRFSIPALVAFLARRSRWVLLLLASLWLVLLPPVQAQEWEEPTFGDSHLDFLRVFNTAQSVDQRWSNPLANSLSMSVPYLTDQVWLEATSYNYWREVSVGGTLAGWSPAPSETFNFTRNSHFSTSAAPLQPGANIISVVSTFPNLPAETYTLTITRLPPSSVTELSAITLPAGYNLSPAFSPAVKNYTLNVGSYVSSLSLSPVAREYGTVTINGAASGQPVPLQVGANTLTLQVTAQDGVTTDSYTLAVNRADPANDPSLASLSLTSYQGTETAAVLDYDSSTITVSVPYHTTAFSVTANTANAQSVLHMGGVVMPQVPATAAFDLSGNSMTIPLQVFSPDGNSSRQYTLVVNRTPVSTDASLSSLNAQGSAIYNMVPGFDPGVTSYSFGYTSVGDNTDMPSMTLQVSTRHRFATLTINGQAATSGEASTLALAMGDNTITVEVTAEDGVTRQTYTLLVRRNGNYREALLTDLVPSLGRLSPAFSASVTDYVLTVPTNAQTATLTPIAAPSTARLGTIRINHTVTASGSASAPITVSSGASGIQVDVTSGDTRTFYSYWVALAHRDPGRSADLSGITLSAGRLRPAFVTTTSTYQVAVPAALTTLRVTPQAVDGYASVVVNGTPLPASGWVDVALPPGSSTISVHVTSEDQQQQMTYSLQVSRLNETELASLQLSQGVLQPAFAPDVISYRALLAHTVSSLDLQAETGGVLRVNGTLVASGASTSVPLAVGSNTVVLEVTSQDGSQRQEIRLQLTRAPDPAQRALQPGFGHSGFSTNILTTTLGVGDVNGDGLPDLLVVDSPRDGALVSYLNSASGLQAGGRVVIPGLGSPVMSTGDLNGDGKADVVLTKPMVDGVGIIALSNGDGTFRETIRLTLGTFPGPAVIADFNGDGRPDVVFQSLERLHYLAGNGDGSFAAPVVIELPSFTGYALQRAVSADFNRDGRPDLLLLLSGGRVQVLRGNGDGTFAPQAVLGSACISSTPHLLLGDINQDGWVDALNVGDDGTVDIRLGNGDGSFLPPTCLATGLAVKKAALGDANDDGVPDLLLGLRDTWDRRVAVLAGNGGSFAAADILPLRYSPDDRIVPGFYDMLTADFDGDGRLDVALAAPGLSEGVFLGISRPTPLRALTPSAGTLEPVLGGGRDYRIRVGRAHSSLTLTPELLAGSHSVRVNGTAVASGSPSAALPLQIGDNAVTVTVTAASGRMDTYRLNVVRDLPLTPPLNVTATAGDARATVSFDAPLEDGGNPVLGYTVQVSPDEGVDSTTDPLSRQRTITGLRNGVSYSFTVTARNALGSSLPSAASAAVTPEASSPVTPTDPGGGGNTGGNTGGNSGGSSGGEIGAGSHTVIDGSGTVVVGSQSVGASLTVAGSQPVSIRLGGLPLGVQGSPGSVLKVVLLTVNGNPVPALAVSQGTVQLSASQAGQVLLGLNGEALVAGSADTRLHAGSTLLAVTQGFVLLPANGFAAGSVSRLMAGEQAVLNAEGRILRVRLGSMSGDGPGDALALPAVSGLTVSASVPRLSGSINRWPEGLAAVVQEAVGLPASTSVTQGSDGVVRLASGMQLLPVGEVLIDESVADGVTPTVDGLARLVRNGVVLTLAPAVADLPALIGDLRRLAADAAVSVTPRGLLRVRLDGGDYVLRPDWMRQATVETGGTLAGGRFVSAAGGDGVGTALAYVDARGGRQWLYPGFVDPAQVCQRVLAAVPAARCQTDSDGRIGVQQDGVLFRLQASMQVGKADAAAEPHAGRGWWLGESGSLYFLFADEVQTATVQ